MGGGSSPCTASIRTGFRHVLGGTGRWAHRGHRHDEPIFQMANYCARFALLVIVLLLA